jgi:excisionase family DNA binding protein
MSNILKRPIAQVAALHGLGYYTVYRAAQRGELKTWRLGSRIYSTDEAVEAWLDRNVLPRPEDRVTVGAEPQSDAR